MYDFVRLTTENRVMDYADTIISIGSESSDYRSVKSDESLLQQKSVPFLNQSQQKIVRKISFIGFLYIKKMVMSLQGSSTRKVIARG